MLRLLTVRHDLLTCKNLACGLVTESVYNVHPIDFEYLCTLHATQLSLLLGVGEKVMSTVQKGNIGLDSLKLDVNQGAMDAGKLPGRKILDQGSDPH